MFNMKKVIIYLILVFSFLGFSFFGTNIDFVGVNLKTVSSFLALIFSSLLIFKVGIYKQEIAGTDKKEKIITAFTFYTLFIFFIAAAFSLSDFLGLDLLPWASTACLQCVALAGLVLTCVLRIHQVVAIED